MTVPAIDTRAIGLALGFAADRLLGDPQRLHPVAGFGTLAAGLERRSYADDRGAGAAHTLALVIGTAAAGHVIERSCRTHPVTHTAVIALTTWAVLGGRSLEREANAVHDHLVENDLKAARQRIRSLVGRDPSELDESELSRAVLESVAENTSDAVVAPLCWGALLGVPGLLGYRALNTLDAMIGHRSPRYENFGWAAARLDDLANWAPARLSAGLATVFAPLVQGSPKLAWTVWRRDAHQHPSPNAGQVEAAFAGALDVQLGGTNNYHGQVENRGHLGDGPPARPADIARGNQLAAWVGRGALAVAVVCAVVVETTAVSLRTRRTASRG